MAKSENIFVKAKAYQKLHPRTPWAECIQKVKGKHKVSGAKPKAAVSGPKRKKRARVAAKPVGSSRVTVRSVKTRIQRGVQILKEIDKLEAKAKEVSNKDLKHLYYAEINTLHKKLVNLKKSA